MESEGSIEFSLINTNYNRFTSNKLKTRLEILQRACHASKLNLATNSSEN